MPVKTLLSVLIFAASCVYIMCFVCVHAHTCAHVHLLEFVYSLDLRTGNHNGLTPIGLEREEC